LELGIRKFITPNSRFMIRNSIVKIICLLLIVSLNWTGLLAIGRTFAYFFDNEGCNANTFQSAILDFSIPSVPDFSPKATPDQNSGRAIGLENDGNLDFEYLVKVENATGTLCDYLLLKDDLTGVFQPLSNFVSATTTFSNKSNWQFEAKLTSSDPGLQNKACVFDFLFDGWQVGGAGFSDQEAISNTILSGIWQKVLINKVYYDVDSAHGAEPANEWIELYNPLGNPVDISGWAIEDNNGTDVIPASSPIPANGFAVITASSTTWDYWEIPDDVVKIVLADGKIGNGLNNDADMLALKDDYGNIVDQMNWGTPTSTWPNYNSNLWDPGCPDADEGHMLARVPTGYDTDTASDWQDLGLPNISGINVTPLQSQHCGCCGNGNENRYQCNCPTGWYCAPGVYYSRQLSINWTATTSNTSGNDNLSVDITYITDSDCSGDISGGDNFYTIASGIANSGSYVWAGWTNVNGWHHHLWKDENGDVVPYFYGLTWIQITATGPENFMVNNSKASTSMFEPLPPGISLEDICLTLGNCHINSCSCNSGFAGGGGGNEAIDNGGAVAASAAPSLPETATSEATSSEDTGAGATAPDAATMEEATSTIADAVSTDTDADTSASTTSTSTSDQTETADTTDEESGGLTGEVPADASDEATAESTTTEPTTAESTTTEEAITSQDATATEATSSAEEEATSAEEEAIIAGEEEEAVATTTDATAASAEAVGSETETEITETEDAAAEQEQSSGEEEAGTDADSDSAEEQAKAEEQTEPTEPSIQGEEPSESPNSSSSEAVGN